MLFRSVQDLGHAAMREKVEGFLKSSAGADFAAIYFGGHGVQVGQRVYLVPVDADLNDPASLSKLVHLRDIRLGMAKARHGLVVLDSCRNSPADGWRQVEAERSAVVMANQAGDNPPNLLLLFSTAPGRVALDGPPGDNSPFAVALLQQLASGSVDLREIADRKSTRLNSSH